MATHNFQSPPGSTKLDDKKWGTLPRVGKSPVTNYNDDDEFSAGHKQRPKLNESLFENNQFPGKEDRLLQPRRNSTPVPNFLDNDQQQDHQLKAHTIENPLLASLHDDPPLHSNRRSSLTPITNPEELIQLAESTAIQAYKSRMDSLLKKSYFGYMDLRNYHDELVTNITSALKQTLLNNYYYDDDNNSVEDIVSTILTNLERLFRSQFSVYLNKNEVKIESWVKEVKAVTNEAVLIFETVVREGLETAIADGSFQPDYLFKNLEEEGKRKAVQSFSRNCRSKNNELIEKIDEKAEDLKEEYETRLNDFISKHQQPDSQKISSTPLQPPPELIEESAPKFVDSHHHHHQWAEQDGETVKKAVAQNQNLQIHHHEQEGGQIEDQVKAMPQQVPVTSIVSSKTSGPSKTSKLIFYLSFSSTWVRRLDFNHDNNSSEPHGKKSSGKSLQNFPPYIYYSPTAILIGHDAQQGKDRPGFFSIPKILRDVYSHPNLVVDSVRLTSEEIIAQYLEQVTKEMTTNNSETIIISECIMVHPACLTTFQKRRLKMAADLANFHGKNSLVPLYRTVADFLACHWTLPDQPHPVLIIHYTVKCFDVVVATYSKTDMRILSYAGAENVENPQNFLSLHTKMIQTILTHQSTPKLKEPTLTYYYEIIRRSLDAASTLYDSIQNVYVIFESNTIPIKTVVQQVLPRKAIIELDENKMFTETFFQQFEKFPTTIHRFAMGDIYPRNFGFIVNKKIHRFIQKKNEPLPPQKLISQFAFPSVKGLNELTLGERMEKETYRFQSNGSDQGVSVHVTTTPEGMYDIKLMTATNGPIPLTNTTFPYLATLNDKIAAGHN